MDVALFSVRVLLAFVFAAAGVAKASDLPRSRKAIADFGIPPRLAIFVGAALPPAEIAVALLLFSTPVARWGAVASLVLLVVFIVAIATNLARGRRPECQCFGQIRSRPIGWSALARNVLLALGAFWIARSGPGGASAYAVLAVAGAAIFAAQTWLIFHLFKQHGQLLLRMDAIERRTGVGQPVLSGFASIHGLPVGAPAPAFDAPSLSGSRVTLEMLRLHGKPILLVFSDPDCPACADLWPMLRQWQHDYRGALTIAIVNRESSAEELRRGGASNGLEVLLQTVDEIAGPYGARMTPAAVLIRSDGAIGSHVAVSAGAIRDLVWKETQAFGQVSAENERNRAVLESATALS